MSLSFADPPALGEGRRNVAGKADNVCVPEMETLAFGTWQNAKRPLFYL